MLFTVIMTYKKETKGTLVFENNEEDTPITVLYIKKKAFTTYPASITVQVKVQ